MQHRNRLVGMVAIFAVLALVFEMRAADWPQWRGPQRNGISNETGLLRDWPTEGPKLLWQVTDVGSGYSTPAVVGDRVYLLGSRGMDDEFVQALSASDGSHIWSVRIGKVGANTPTANFPGARSTPTVDGDVLYALGSDGDLVCMELAGGKIRWQKNLRTDFAGEPGLWAYAESPLVDGDTLVCTPGGAEATMIALKKNSGETIWKCAAADGEAAGYASVVITYSGGIKQYVQLLGKSVIGVEAQTGKFLWRYLKQSDRDMPNIPTPVVDGSYVYAVPKRLGGSLIKINAQDPTAEPEQIYFSAKLPSAIGGTVKLGAFLYGTTGQGLHCVDFASGEVKWSDRSLSEAAVCYADGCLYLHGENEGNVALVEATPEGYREKGRFTPPGQPERGQAKAWAYPVVANGRFYIRDQEVLWCYDVKAQHASP